jgi:hypothetical protein
MYLYGSVGPNSGQASVALNGQVVEDNLNLTVGDDSRVRGCVH